MKKRFLLTAGMAASLLFASGCTNDDSNSVATVNGTKITEKEMDKQMKELYGASTLSTMIQVKLLESKYSVTKDDVEKRFKEMKANFSTEKEFDAFIKQNYPSEQFYKDNVIRINLLAEKATTDGVKVSEDEMKTYYERSKQEIKARHILVDKEEDAKKIYEELKNGADFAAIAKEKSKDTGSAQEGGLLPTFSVGQMVTEFEDASYSLKPGEMSQPIKSQHGYHIIKLEEKTDKKSGVKPYNEMKDKIEKDLKAKKAKSVDEVMQKLLKDAKIEVQDKDLKNVLDKIKSAQGK